MKKVALAATNVVSVRTGHLHDVVNDTKSRPYCGPTAVAAITGEPISEVLNAYRLVRHGARWTGFDRAPPIRGTSLLETSGVLKLFGYVGSWRHVEEKPTLAYWLNGRSGMECTHPCVINVTRHFVAVSGWVFCDTLSSGQVVDADEAPGRRKRVSKVFVVTARVTPTAHIPAKIAAPASSSGHRARRKTKAVTVAVTR